MARELGEKHGKLAYPVVEAATYALVVDPDLPFSCTTVPALAAVIPLVQTERIIQSVQVVPVDVHHVVGTPGGVSDPGEDATRLISHLKVEWIPLAYAFCAFLRLRSRFGKKWQTSTSFQILMRILYRGLEYKIRIVYGKFDGEVARTIMRFTVIIGLATK